MTNAEPEASRSSKVETDRFKAVMSTFPTGVAIVTALSSNEPVGFTCQSIVSLSLEPAYVALAPAKSSTSWPRIAEAGTFCINILASGQESLARRFAVSGADKFPGLAWSPGTSGAPVLEGVLSYVECDLELIHDAGDHEIVIGRVRDVGLGESADGPLIFYRSGYGRLAAGGN